MSASGPSGPLVLNYSHQLNSVPIRLCHISVSYYGYTVHIVNIRWKVIINSERLFSE